MDTALRLLHASSAVVLLTAHCAFLIRGLAIEAGRIKPGRLDRLARSLAQVLLPVTALSGLVLRLAVERQADGMAIDGTPPAGIPPISSVHLILGFAPLAAIPAVFFGRLLLKKRRQAPWLLPVLNLIFIVAAGITGIVAGR